MVRMFNLLIFAVISLLLIMSCLALIDIHWDFFDSDAYVFSFTPHGIKTYLQGFGEYRVLFIGTVATTAAYFGLLRLKITNKAKSDKMKQDRFSEFKTTVDERVVEVESTDPYLKREFVRVRHNLYNDLKKKGFSILNLSGLTQVFDTHFKNVVRFLEEHNNRYVEMGGIYYNNRQSYSFDSFRFVFQACLDTSYDDFESDLLNLYLAAMNPERFINAKIFESASRNYLPHR